MTEQELIERLAAKEHASWARWMEYLFSKCVPTSDGLLIPQSLVTHWHQLINTGYLDLPEHSKQADRDEVAHILPLIHQFLNERIVGLWQTCPKCNGQKHVSVPPYLPGDVKMYSSSSTQSHTCPVCDGRGLVALAQMGGVA